jgi:hypothetical protein
LKIGNRRWKEDEYILDDLWNSAKEDGKTNERFPTIFGYLLKKDGKMME